jgi:hypothetical protein
MFVLRLYRYDCPRWPCGTARVLPIFAIRLLLLLLLLLLVFLPRLCRDDVVADAFVPTTLSELKELKSVFDDGYSRQPTLTYAALSPPS